MTRTPAGRGMPNLAAARYRGTVARICTSLVLLGLLGGCSSMLPSSKEGTPSGSWQTYKDAADTFEKIAPGRTTVAELRELKLDPAVNPSVAKLHRAEVMQRFLVGTVPAEALDATVRECVAPDAQCRAFEINHVATQTKRNGNAALDLLRIHRETHTAGWRFTGLILVKDGVVVYKLSGGQPLIQQVEKKSDVLGPLQALSSRYLNADSISNLASSRSRPASEPAGEPVSAVSVKK